MEVVLFPWEVGTILEAWRVWNAYASPEAFVGEADFLAEVLDMGRTSLAALAHVVQPPLTPACLRKATFANGPSPFDAQRLREAPWRPASLPLEPEVVEFPVSRGVL